MSVTTTTDRLVLKDPRLLINNQDADLLAADPTAKEFIQRAKARVAALDPQRDPKRRQALNDAIVVTYEQLLQLEPNTIAALGFGKPISPARSDLSGSNRGGVLDTAAGGPLKAMASTGELRKLIEDVEPVKKSDGSIDEVATAAKLTMRGGAALGRGRLSPDGRRLK
jgi:hypothetical protein